MKYYGIKPGKPAESPSQEETCAYLYVVFSVGAMPPGRNQFSIKINNNKNIKKRR
jgi:hypothetical protein